MRLLFGIAAIILPLSAQAYMPPPGSLLGAMLDPEIDPLVLEQLMEEDGQAATTDDTAEDTTWEEDAAAWEAENDPLVLDQEIFDENGNWIDVMDVLGGMTDESATTDAMPEASHQAAPAAMQTSAPSATEGGKPVLYRGGKVFEPGAAVHEAAEEPVEPEQPAPEETGTTSVPEEAVEDPSVSDEADTAVDANTTATGETLDGEEVLTATGATDTQEGEATTETEEEGMPEASAEEEGSSWLGGSIMTIALAAGAIGLGVMLLLFKGKVTGGAKAKNAPDASAPAVPAAPAPEESKLQHAIDEMRGKE